MGDILTIRAENVGLGDLAVVENWMPKSLAQVVEIQKDEVALQIFTVAKGFPPNQSVLSWPFRASDLLAQYRRRIFDGWGGAIDGGPRLGDDRRVEVGGPSSIRHCELSRRSSIETKVPMIDVFNCLVESKRFRSFLLPVNHTTNCWPALGFKRMPK